jgi:hypothetical protein
LNAFAKGIVRMIFINLQGRFFLLGGEPYRYSPKQQAKRNSISILISVVVAHVVLIFIVFIAKNEKVGSELQPILQMIQLSPEVEKTAIEIEKPEISFQANVVDIKLPKIDINDDSLLRISLSDYQSPTPYEFPNPNDAKYRDVFDPKMRQKLIDAQAINKPRAKEKSGSWTESDGRVFIDMGDGNCFASMPKTDWRERGTNWGSTRCGKTDSKKMMDSVMADFESRKHPLKTQ